MSDARCGQCCHWDKSMLGPFRGICRAPYHLTPSVYRKLPYAVRLDRYATLATEGKGCTAFEKKGANDE